MRSILKFLMTLVLIAVIAAGGLLGWLTAVEFQPAPVEKAELVSSGVNSPVKTDEDLSLLCWNIGYGGLGKNEDFFMDGGKLSKPQDRNVALAYLDGIRGTIAEQAADLVILQEVDSDSSRTYGLDERSYLDQGMSSESYALNYSCPFVPVPWPPIGKVHSGLFTMTKGLAIDEANRVALPCPFSWPMRIANLKRCLLVSYLPVEGSNKKLVLVNLHLEAYDSGEGKIAQTKQLRGFIEDEYAKGNYVIAGGDFNQVFPASTNHYPVFTPELWSPGIFETGVLPVGTRFVADYETPSCRLLNEPYDAETAQHYVIDGFILSRNVHVERVETLDLGFENSDHNPVSLHVTLE